MELWNSFIAAPGNPGVQYHRAPKSSMFPGAPSRPEISTVTDTTVHLTWNPSSHKGGSPIYTYTIEYFSPQTGKVILEAQFLSSVFNYFIKYHTLI